MGHQLIYDTEKTHYAFNIDGFNLCIKYILVKEKLSLIHTEVPKAQTGKSVGSAIVKAVLEDVDARGLTSVLFYPFVTM